MSDELRIDPRTTEDIEYEIQKLAKSYVPEWKFVTNQPDIGSVIGMIFASQMNESINRYNGFLDRCHLEYMNILGVSQKAAHPARMVVAFTPVVDSETVLVEKGTGIVVNTAAEEPSRIIFEVMNPISITTSKIKNLILSNQEKLLAMVLYRLENRWDVVKLELDESKVQFNKRLCLFHKSAFQTKERAITMHVDGNIQIADELSKGNYRLQYVSNLGIENAKIINTDGKNVTFLLDHSLKRIVDDDEDEGMNELVLTQIKPSAESVNFRQITFSSIGESCEAEFVSNNQIEQDKSEFYMFGNQLNLYTECYIGMDDYFSQGGAYVTVDFQVSIKEQMIGQRPQKPADLRIIKRKKKFDYEEVIADAYADQVIYEYYTEQGWKKLNILDEEMKRNIFNGKHDGLQKIQFQCPKDWQAVSLEGYYGRCIRIQLVASQHCYLQPCRHHLPYIRGLNIAYSYENTPQSPYYYQIEDLNGKYYGPWKNQITTVFSATDIDEDALYIGLDEKPVRGPVSIYVKLADRKRFQGIQLRFEYSSKDGFKQMIVYDHTQGGRISGTIVFMPPMDFIETQIGGEKAYYIRIVDTEKIIRTMKTEKPVIENMIMNATEAMNLQTLDEQEFYIDQPSANMKFELGYTNIYDIDVWVNEMSQLSDAQCQALLKNYPEQCRPEYNSQGKIRNFFVHWDEVDDFLAYKEKRVYVLDRAYGTIIFGDGVNNPIPQNVKDAAFVVKIRICNNVVGNVGAYSVEGLQKTIPSIARVYNPYPAYGGTQTEPVDLAEFRGTHMISSSHRLITKKDYEKEVMSYSDNIVRTRCVIDDENHIVIILLIKDCEDGMDTFSAIQNDLKEKLLTKCETTVSADKILIREPIFVELSVQLWGKCSGDEDMFMLQENVNECLSDYLKPVTGNNGNGWEIGEIPDKAQIIMKLQFVSKKIRIENCVVHAQYTDETGVHEVDAEELKGNPYIMIRSGKHAVHLI